MKRGGGDTIFLIIKIKRKIAEIEYSVKKLIKKYIELDKRISAIEREKAAAKATASTKIYRNKINVGEKSFEVVIRNSDSNNLVKKHCQLR